MADSAVFDRTCELLEQLTYFDALQARGTVRLAVKAADLSAKTIGKAEMLNALRGSLEPELAARNVPNAAEVCRRLLDALAAFQPGDPGRSGASVLRG